MLTQRDGPDGLFQRNLSAGSLGPRHDHAYVAEQQTHFALQALRLLGRLEPAPPVLHLGFYEARTGQLRKLWRARRAASA